MSIDLSKLSAKELFELAQKKEQEEQEFAEQKAEISELQAKREAMLNDHKVAMNLAEKKIKEMQAVRDNMVIEHKKELAALDKQLKALEAALPKPKGAFKATSSSTPESNVSLKATLRQIMNRRAYISASLLKEQLATHGVKPDNFNKELEQWVRDGWFENKGKGNYALGKKL